MSYVVKYEGDGGPLYWKEDPIYFSCELRDACRFESAEHAAAEVERLLDEPTKFRCRVVKLRSPSDERADVVAFIRACAEYHDKEFAEYLAHMADFIRRGKHATRL